MITTHKKMLMAGVALAAFVLGAAHSSQSEAAPKDTCLKGKLTCLADGGHPAYCQGMYLQCKSGGPTNW